MREEGGVWGRELGPLVLPTVTYVPGGNLACGFLGTYLQLMVMDFRLSKPGVRIKFFRPALRVVVWLLDHS
jgi:hypothetical protein